MPTWSEARVLAHAAGTALPSIELKLADTDGYTLAEPLVTLVDLPPFPTSSVDGWAGRGPQPWRITGQVLAGENPPPLTRDGTCVEIATGALVPDGVETILWLEDALVTDGVTNELWVTGQPRPHRNWRAAGEEAERGEVLLPAGTPVTPGVIGLAASCGHDRLRVRRPVRAAVLVFGDELLEAGLPSKGMVRDALGPQLPAWLRRYGCMVVPPAAAIKDTLDAHVAAVSLALTHTDVVCTTGGTMRGPVDYLHPALVELGASYVVNTVEVRPGFPMLLARMPGGKFVAGLPGNPQSAIVALVSLVAPLLAGLAGRAATLPRVVLGEEIGGRGNDTRLALVRIDADGLAFPLPHAGSAMLRGLAQAAGFAVIPPGRTGMVGASVELVPLPSYQGELS